MDPPTTIDPATGLPLPPDAIVRVLHITTKVHIYTLPPSSLSTSYTAASWTALPQNPIFTARLRVLETTLDEDDDPASSASSESTTKVDILLEQPADGTLFAAAPYTTTAIVTPCTDSSRFFALRIQDPQTKAKATIGIGFEERSEAFDFGVVLQESAKHLGFHESSGGGGAGGAQAGGAQKAAAAAGDAAGNPKAEKKDYSLKDGETITVNLGNTKFGRRIRAASVAKPEEEKSEEKAAGGSLNSFALPPPPGSGPSGFGGAGFGSSSSASSSGSGAEAGSGGGGGGSFLPPPPNAREIRAQKRLSAQQMGFDDGPFGEFA